MRLGSAAACLATATELAEHFDEISVPFLCLSAGKDTVVDPDGPARLFEQASTPENKKKLVVFPDALHGLMCEPKGTREEILACVQEWLAQILVEGD
mmetsp:Transcript_29159/g.85108  ORF Transcript_29159/g.85108 Transcript_29159/m.85108 type:complete len:97 (+) Transcript_29159:1-291(+)